MTPKSRPHASVDAGRKHRVVRHWLDNRVNRIPPQMKVLPAESVEVCDEKIVAGRSLLPQINVEPATEDRPQMKVEPSTVFIAPEEGRAIDGD